MGTIHNVTSLDFHNRASDAVRLSAPKTGVGEATIADLSRWRLLTSLKTLAAQGFFDGRPVAAVMPHFTKSQADRRAS